MMMAVILGSKKFKGAAKDGRDFSYLFIVTHDSKNIKCLSIAFDGNNSNFGSEKEMSR